MAAAAAAAAAAGGLGAPARAAGLPGLGRPFEVPFEDRLEFERNGVIQLKGLLPEIGAYSRALRYGWTVGALEYVQESAELLGCALVYRERMHTSRGGGTPGSDEEVEAESDKVRESMKALEDCAVAERPGQPPERSLKYFQAVNLIRFNPDLEEWVRNARVASAISQLLDAPVRLYQDGYFRKGDPKDMTSRTLRTPTMIHTDLTMVPARTNTFATAWCPLRPLDKNAPGATPLMFIKGSQKDMDDKRLGSKEFEDVQREVRSMLSGRAGANGKLVGSDSSRVLKVYADPTNGFGAFLKYGKGPALEHLDGKIYTSNRIDEESRTEIERFCRSMLEEAPDFDVTAVSFAQVGSGGFEGNHCLASFAYRRKLLDGLLKKFPSWGKENGAWVDDMSRGGGDEAEADEDADGDEDEDEDEDFDAAIAKHESPEKKLERMATEAAFVADVVVSEFYWAGGGGGREGVLVRAGRLHNPPRLGPPRCGRHGQGFERLPRSRDHALHRRRRLEGSAGGLGKGLGRTRGARRGLRVLQAVVGQGRGRRATLAGGRHSAPRMAPGRAGAGRGGRYRRRLVNAFRGRGALRM